VKSTTNLSWLRDKKRLEKHKKRRTARAKQARVSGSDGRWRRYENNKRKELARESKSGSEKSRGSTRKSNSK
jgi:hypothetical protein